MPIYEYRCQSCHHELEKLQRLRDPVLTHCPQCGKAKLRRIMSAAGFRLKGAGWYETDFKQGNKRNLAESSGGKSQGDSTAESSGGKSAGAVTSESSAGKSDGAVRTESTGRKSAGSAKSGSSSGGSESASSASKSKTSGSSASDLA